jgi:ATP-dependent RNA helicase RhlE
MHPEDYVHRIGRTGRAHAVGDAISFATPEDYGALRSLERFIGRGIVRKKAEGFNYAAAAAPGGPPETERHVAQRHNQPAPRNGPQRQFNGPRPNRPDGQRKQERPRHQQRRWRR